MRAMVIAGLVVGCGAPGGDSHNTEKPAPAPTARPTPAPIPSVSNVFSDPVEYRARPISVAAGRTYFLHTGVGDPYAAGIAYPVFLALQHQFPRKLGRDWNGFNARFGTIARPKHELPVGFHLTTDPITGVKFLMMNCQVCHTARLRLPAGDRIVPGMGNKQVRLHAYASALLDIAVDPRLDSERTLLVASELAAKRSLKWPHEYAGAIVGNTLREMRRRAKVAGPGARRLARGCPAASPRCPGFRWR